MIDLCIHNFETQKLIDSLSDTIEKYGESNVESTMIYILRSTDSEGFAVNILPTKEMVAELLDVVHRGFHD